MPVRAMPVIDRRALIGTGLALAGLARGASAAGRAVRVDDPRLPAILDPLQRLRTLYEGGRLCAGTCWSAALDGLVFSDVPANRILLLRREGEVRTLVAPSGNAAGNALDATGRLVTCEPGGRRVVRWEADGEVTVLAEAFAGRPLDAPGSLALGPDGAIWFTDPAFGITDPDAGLRAPPEQRARRVYRVSAPGAVEAVTAAVGQPGGLAFTPDGRTLLVSDSAAALNPEGASAILAFPVEAGRLGDPRVLARLEQAVPAGLRVDGDGRIYAACTDGVRIYAPDGAPLGRIATPRPARDLAFGGRDGQELFVAAGGMIHAVTLKAPAATRF